MAQEVLLAEKLCSGDRPSVYVAGMLLAHALRKMKLAVVMVDALGQVVLMPEDAVQVFKRPLVQEEDLHQLSEDEAIAVMAKEERKEEEILEYLKTRKAREYH